MDTICLVNDSFLSILSDNQIKINQDGVDTERKLMIIVHDIILVRLITGMVM